MFQKPLMFTVGLIDQITKPIAKISQQFTGLSSNYQAGTMKMASGLGGIAASAYALNSAMKPAIEIDRALGEVKSLGVRDSALKKLTDTSFEYALKYGKSATEFISSSYDIQSAISGLNDTDLSAFTLSSNVLATATKADAATITNYMGTMYGIFKNKANAMGKTNWVEQVTGMTATAVEIFKTNGMEMSSAFTAIGAEANSHGIGMNEQMAILGTLQSTMSGSQAGTKYQAFLGGVGKAQKALGLEFTDSHNKMLPMVDILHKIKGKYGETLDVAESDALAKAFGTKEAAATIKLLMGDIDGLNGSIDKLGKVKGMQQAEKMAAAMTDQSQRLAQSWFVIRAAFGTAILPVFNRFAGWLADTGRDLVSFTEKHPILTKYLGYTATAILGLVAAGGLMTVMVGASTMALTTWQAVVDVSSIVGSGYSAVLTFLQTRLSGLTFTTMFSTAKLWLNNKAMTASNLTTLIYANTIGKAKLALEGFNMMATTSGGYLPAFGAIIKAATLSTWSFVASLTAATLPFVAIVGLVVGVAVAVYKYWQPIKAFLGGFWDGLTEGFAPVGAVFSELFDAFSFVGDMFSWMGEQVGFNTKELAGFADMGKKVGSFVAGAFSPLVWIIKQIGNGIIGVINLVKNGVGAISDFLGFGDQSITTEQIIGVDNKVIKNNQPMLPSSMVPENTLPMPLGMTPNNIVPFPLSTMTVDNGINQPVQQQNNVTPFVQPIVPATLAAEAKQAQQLKARPESLAQLPSLKLERTQAQPSVANNSNANSTDNSKRVFIENVNMTSDDINRDLEIMLELTG